MLPNTLHRRVLRDWLLDESKSRKAFAIIDVRDDDHVGGHIVTSRNHPSATFLQNLPFLHDELEDVPIVIFHCALSQQRGPAAASMYLRYREMIGKPADAQEVYVLTGGFTEWQKDYGKDTRLTAGYDEGLWKYYE